jgi:hypothetical protein
VARAGPPQKSDRPEIRQLCDGMYFRFGIIRQTAGMDHGDSVADFVIARSLLWGTYTTYIHPFFRSDSILYPSAPC